MLQAVADNLGACQTMQRAAGATHLGATDGPEGLNDLLPLWILASSSKSHWTASDYCMKALEHCIDVLADCVHAALRLEICRDQ